MGAAEGVVVTREALTESTGFRVVFTPSGIGGDVPEGTTVLDAARRLGVDLDSVCGGRGLCGRCAVVPGAGRFPKWSIDVPNDAWPDSTSLEIAYAARRGLPATQRLGCQISVTRNVVIDVPASSQLHRPIVRKTVDVGEVDVDPTVRLHYVVVEPATLDDPRSATQRLIEALARDHGLIGVEVAMAALRPVVAVLGATDGCTVAVATRADGRPRVVAGWSGLIDTAYGIAVDIGSTTIAGHLCDLYTGEVLASAGSMNPQIRFGEDLMSRVSYVMMNAGGDVELTTAVRAAIDALCAELAMAAAVGLDRVLSVVLVGNPIMHHLVLGLDPVPLGGAPFELAINTAVECRAIDIGLALPNAELYVGPLIAGHVGADTAAAILAEGPHRADRVQLLVDVGTNAEIVLGNADRLYAASSPTGPAFEGAQLSSGQRATVGAIERVRIDRDTLEPRVRVIGCDVWSDDPGFAAGTAGIATSGICGSGVIEAIGELFLCGAIRPDGTFDEDKVGVTNRLVRRGRTLAYELWRGDGMTLSITQNDVRAIQLAKAALRAGIELLRERSGLATIDEVRLAGAFGSHIDPVYALVLGLVPDAPVDSVTAAGNAAGSGAVRALLSAAQRREMERVVAGVVKIETAIEASFQEHFVAAMGFPHTTAPSAHLAAAVDLPERPTPTAGPTRRRQRARTKT